MTFSFFFLVVLESGPRVHGQVVVEKLNVSRLEHHCEVKFRATTDFVYEP
jgi:hypothetical protein